MKRSIILILTVFALCIMCALPSLATDGLGQMGGDAVYRNVIDNAGLLSDSEKAELSQKLENLKNELQFDIAVVTTNSTEGKDIQSYAEDYYDYGGFGYGEGLVGTLIVLDMGSSEVYMTVTEQGSRFTDDKIDSVTESMLADLQNGDYAAAFNVFADSVKKFASYEQAENDYVYAGDYDYDYDSDYSDEDITLGDCVIIAVIGGLIIALCVTLPMVFSLKSVKAHSGAKNYQRAGSFSLTLSTERFLYSHVTKRKKDPPKSSGGGGNASATVRRGGGMKF